MTEPSAQPPKILVGLPSGDRWHPDFGMAMIALAVSFHSGIAVPSSRRSCYISTNRHNFVKDAKSAGCDYLFMVDSDMVVPHDTLDRLLGHGRLVTGVVYPRRGEGLPMVGTPMPGTSLRTDMTGLREMRMLGTGCILIDMHVFDNWRPPFFRMRADEDRGEEDGEDAVFCERAFNQGTKMWADLDLSREVEHVGERRYTYRDAGRPAHKEGWDDGESGKAGALA